MLSFRTGHFIRKFLNGEKGKQDLHSYIRETRDPIATLFAQHVALYNNYHQDLGTVASYQATISALYRDIIRVLNHYGVNIHGHNVNIGNPGDVQNAWNDIEDLLVIFIGVHHIDAHNMTTLADNIADLFVGPDTDTLTEALHNIDDQDTFYQFFVFEALAHQHNLGEQYVAQIDHMVFAWLNNVPVPEQDIQLLGNIGHPPLNDTTPVVGSEAFSHAQDAWLPGAEC